MTKTKRRASEDDQKKDRKKDVRLGEKHLKFLEMLQSRGGFANMSEALRHIVEDYMAAVEHKLLTYPDIAHRHAELSSTFRQVVEELAKRTARKRSTEGNDGQ